MRKTNTKPKMLRATAIALCLLCLFQACPVYATPASVKVTPTGTVENSGVYLNGEMIVCSAYNIGGANYFKLRDIMQKLNIYVSYTEVTKTINIYTNWPYIPDGAETSALIESNNAKGIATEFLPTTAVPTTAEVLFDGRKVDWEAYNIGGSNHFKLRDICSALNISVEWEEDTRLVLINTAFGYGEDTKRDKFGGRFYSDEELKEYMVEMVRLANEERVKEGRQEMQMLDTLFASAQAKADDMAENNYFAHLSPTIGNYSKTIPQYVPEANWCLEIIHAGYVPYARDAIFGWLGSPGHKAAMLNPGTTHVGVGIAFNSITNEYIVVMQFVNI